MLHLPIADQGRYLARVLNGFFNYFAVPTNCRALNSSITMSAGIGFGPAATEPAATG